MNRLIKGAALLVCASLPTLAAWAGDDVKSTGSQENWVSLFDGSTLSGWTMIVLRPGEQSKWEVVDGALVGTGQASMLFSPRGDYKNFRCRAEIKINDRGNSGMYFRTAKKASFGDGYEAQIDSTHSDPIRTGSIYGMVHIFKQLVPPDTWFTYELEVVDKIRRGKAVPSIKVTVNNEVLYEFLDFSSTFKQGHFALQQHDPGSKVQIRKFEVMELPETPGG
jgi:3-keto-disaccharide hydrolase